MSVKKELESLYFHDSCIRGVSLSFSDGRARSCALDIDYYNWEGNEQARKMSPNEPWKTRRLRLNFGFLAHIEFSAPDLINNAHCLDEAKIGYELSAFEEQCKKFKSEFPNGQHPLESGEVVSIRFTTQNSSDTESGYLWVVGNEVTISWDEEDVRVDQTHFSSKLYNNSFEQTPESAAQFRR